MTSDTLAADRPFNKICMVGLGYIGLPTAAVMASRGLNIIGLDVTPHVVETINKGKIHIVEPHLEDYVKEAVEKGLLRATLTAEPADAFMIAVPTPIDAEKKSDLAYVMSAGRSIAPVIKKGDIVILESTSPVGATEQLLDVLAAERPDLSFPVRGEEGCDVHLAAIALYSLFVDGTLFPTDTRSAELCKLAENAFRDVNIAYANELANVCEGLDMNVWEVIHLAGIVLRLTRGSLLKWRPMTRRLFRPRAMLMMAARTALWRASKPPARPLVKMKKILSSRVMVWRSNLILMICAKARRLRLPVKSRRATQAKSLWWNRMSKRVMIL